MNGIQIFDIVWLLSLLVLLFLIWRSSEEKRKQDKARDEKLIRALIEVSQKDAESARQAAVSLQELVAILKAERHVL